MSEWAFYLETHHRKRWNKALFFPSVERWMQTRKNKRALQNERGWLEQWWLLKFTWIFSAKPLSLSFSLILCDAKMKSNNFFFLSKRERIANERTWSLFLGPANKSTAESKTDFFLLMITRFNCNLVIYVGEKFIWFGFIYFDKKKNYHLSFF